MTNNEEITLEKIKEKIAVEKSRGYTDFYGIRDAHQVIEYLLNELEITQQRLTNQIRYDAIKAIRIGELTKENESLKAKVDELDAVWKARLHESVSTKNNKLSRQGELVLKLQEENTKLKAEIELQKEVSKAAFNHNSEVYQESLAKYIKVVECARLLINSFNDENPASISMVKEHIAMQEDFDNALKELGGES